ncbi:MAG: hypothetical protein LBV74_19525 [Tannerella sp.]|jgi:hypothetical protein|nr:hypothetical protein [Tannerella sp.]
MLSERAVIPLSGKTDRKLSGDGIHASGARHPFTNVELTANFTLKEYPIHYFMNGGENSESNPASYNIYSKGMLLLITAPDKKSGLNKVY